jgi:hypothetical protein
MSIDFWPRKDILASELFDERLKKFRVHEDTGEDFPSTNHRWLTDGRKNYLLWVNDAGSVFEFTRYAWCGDPNHIRAAVAEAFETEISANMSRIIGALKRVRR